MTDQLGPGASAYEAELREVLEILGGAEGWGLPPAALDQLLQVLAQAEWAVESGDAAAMRRASAALVLLQPRLRGLGEQSVPMPDVPLALIADLVHRIRVDLAVDVPVSATSTPVEAEGREGGADAD
jgi:hypothetical protein